MAQCLLWRGWLSGMSPRTFGTPWAVAAGDLSMSQYRSSSLSCFLGRPPWLFNPQHEANSGWPTSALWNTSAAIWSGRGGDTTITNSTTATSSSRCSWTCGQEFGVTFHRAAPLDERVCFRLRLQVLSQSLRSATSTFH